jgi:hypothetical protein
MTPSQMEQNHQEQDILSSACAGEFILIGLSVDTIHRGRPPDPAAAVIITTGRRTAAMCALTTFQWQTR